MFLHLGAAAHLDDGGDIQPVGSAPAGHEHLQANAAGQLAGPADSVAGGGGGKDQAVFGGLFRRGKDLHDGRSAALGDGAHRLFHNVGKAAFFVARGGVGVPVDAAGGQIVVVPFHFGGQLVPHPGVDAAGGQHVHAIPHFGHLAEQHRCAAPHQHIGGIAGAGVGGDAAEGVRPAALHPDQQFAEGQFFPAAPVEPLQLAVGHVQDGLHHGVVAGVILQGQDVFGGDVLGGQHPVVGQLFAPEAHHHDLAPKVGVPDQVAHRTDGQIRQRRVDGDPAAVGMGDGHHAVHVGVFRQQLFFDPLHRHFQHAGGALDGGDDPQQVAGAGGAHLVAVAQPGGAGGGGQFLRRLDAGAPGHIGQGRAFGQVEHMLVDPAAGGNICLGIAQHHPVADDLAAGGDVPQGDLVGLGDGVPGDEAALQFGTGGQIVHRDGDVVMVVDLNGQAFRHCFHLV